MALEKKDQTMLKKINNFLIRHENLLAGFVFMASIWGFTVLMMI
jgi:hypothetical protein